MGMFDEVVCEMPLPDGLSNDVTFQTKSLACELRWYRITKDGRFERAVYVEDDTWFGERTGWEPDDFFGTIRFYGSDSGGGWHEYAVHVEDARVVGAIRVVPEAL